MTLQAQAVVQYQKLNRLAGDDERAWRTAGWSAFERLGLPDRKTETWKYSSLIPLNKIEWHSPVRVDDAEIRAAAARVRAGWGSDFALIVVANGEWRADLSDSVDGVAVEPLRRLHSSVDPDDGFTGLCWASALGSVQIRVAAGAVVARPVLLFNYQSGSSAWVSQAHEWVVGERAEVAFAELVESSGGQSLLHSSLCSIQVGAGAQAHGFRWQNEGAETRYFFDVDARVARDARLHFTQLQTGAAWVRGRTRAQLSDVGAEAELNGLVFGHGTQHVDQRVVASHLAPQTASSQLYKSIVDDKARSVVNGRIFIAQDAQKVNARQMTHSLLIGAGAEADNKPELEVLADDVKANHGASVGRLDEDKIFYLMSRGMTANEARDQLSHAFVADIYMRIPHLGLRRSAEGARRA